MALTSPSRRSPVASLNRSGDRHKTVTSPRTFSRDGGLTRLLDFCNDTAPHQLVLETLYALLLLKGALGSKKDAEARQWRAPPDETYYLKFDNGGSRRVHIQERDDVDDFVRDYNARTFGGGVIVRVVSVSLQKQRLATGRDGTVWPSSTPTFYVHFSDGVVSEMNLEPAEIESWAQKWRSFKIHGREVSITEICDDGGFVIWPERNGSRIL